MLALSGSNNNNKQPQPASKQQAEPKRPGDVASNFSSSLGKTAKEAEVIPRQIDVVQAKKAQLSDLVDLGSNLDLEQDQMEGVDETEWVS